jgi:hypothetical protein
LISSILKEGQGFKKKRRDNVERRMLSRRTRGREVSRKVASKRKKRRGEICLRNCKR